MVVVPHQTPRKDRPTIQDPDSPEVFDERGGLVVIVKDELTARHSAVNVVDRTGYEQARMSWHEIAPMHRRDPVILRSQPQTHKCGSVYVAPIRGTH